MLKFTVWGDYKCHKQPQKANTDDKRIDSPNILITLPNQSTKDIKNLQNKYERGKQMRSFGASLIMNKTQIKIMCYFPSKYWP